MRKLAIFSCAFALAAAAYVWLLSPTAALTVAVIGAVLAVLTPKGDTALRVRLAAVGIAVGFLWSWGYEQLCIVPLREVCGDDVPVTVRVSDFPRSTKYGSCVEAEIEGGTMLLYLDDNYEDLQPGDQLNLRAQIVDVSRGTNENENLYFQAKDISLLGFANEEPIITPTDCVRNFPAHWAKAIRERITELFPSDTEGFMRALMMGDKYGISYATENQMVTSGIIHVFSVSGMHVSLLVGFFMMLVRNKRVAAVLAIIAMLIFAAMLGFSPSVTRAVIMNTVTLLAPIFKRENDQPTSLSVALLIILLCNPWAIASLSLQLSFLAMAGIVLFADPINMRICGFFSKVRRLHGLVRLVSANVSLSLSATVLTLPLIAVSFGSVSLIAPVSNVLLMQLVSFVFTSGFAILLLGLVTPIGMFSAWCISWLIRLILFAVENLSAIPFAAVYTDSEYVIVWVVAVYLMIAVFLFLKKERKLSHLLGAIAATLFCTLGLCMLDAPQCSVTMLDVGQGQTILVQGEMTAAVDCGGDSADENGEALARRLLMTGIGRLDALILTHYDDDHTCGLEQLSQRVEICQLYLPDIPDDSGRQEEVLKIAQRENIEIVYVTQDITLEAGTMKLRLYAPVKNSSDNEGLAALMSMGECDILVTGDMPSDAEKLLIRTKNLPQVELLVAGHHGSKYSTGAELLQATRPQAVLISVGKNPYGHPSREVLERIEEIGAQVFRTDECGDITMMR